MSKLIKNFAVLCVTLTLTFSFSFYNLNAHETKTTDKKLIKVYINPKDLVTQENILLICDGNHLLHVNTIHQDSSGIYYYRAGLYGYCPNGHPYNIDGGCLGYNCPYN